jgi:Mg-chelatase subunit ChlD
VTLIDPSVGTWAEYAPQTIAGEIGEADITKIVNVREVSELVCICVDCSGSMGFRFDQATRLKTAQILLRKFVDQAFRFKVDNFYGLVLFWLPDGDHYWSVVQDLTPLSEIFRGKIDQLERSGGTPPWEAGQVTINRLIAKHMELPHVPMRIIALPD